MIGGKLFERAVPFVLVLMLPAGCGRRKTTVIASCSQPSGLCTDFYSKPDPIIRTSCEKTHDGTWSEGKACDRTGAVVGCENSNSVQWFFRKPGETDEAVKEYVGRLCTKAGGDRGMVGTDWKPK